MRFLAGIFLIAAFFAGSTRGQTATLDVVYLKNGSIFKGTIVELIPEKSVKILSVDGTTREFQMTDVEKITKEQSEFRRTQNSWEESEEERDRNGSGVVLAGGMSLPVGDFGAKTGSKAGMASTGFAALLDGNMAVAPSVAVMFSVVYASNSMKMDNPYSGYGITMDIGSWNNFWLATGLKLFHELPSDAEIFGFGQVGAIFGSTPEITVSNGSRSVKQESASATAFGGGVGGGVRIQRVNISVRYYFGEPEYTITASSGGQSATETFKQSTTCVMLILGIAF
jgi:hypothetical protein